MKETKQPAWRTPGGIPRFKPLPEQPEALRLADYLTDRNRLDLTCDEAADELRRLHALNQELLWSLAWIDRRCPAGILLQEPHKVHTEMAFDAGVCARAALAKAQGASNE